MDARSFRDAAQRYEKDMTCLLRNLIRLPGESTFEKARAERLLKEMVRLGFDRAETDPFGNILGFMGSGRTLIAYDGHIDSVGTGDIANWTFDPFEGYENDQEIGGRGASDQLGGVVAALYGARILKDLGMQDDRFTVMVAATVQEEDCDGLCWQYILGEDRIRPDFVVLTEPTGGTVCRGQRGRMEIRVSVRGVSSHGSDPERGVNAIFAMGEILGELRELNGRLADDPFLGKGTLTVSEIFSTTPSRCAVADGCAISIDRRLTMGETGESALREISELPAVRRHGAVVGLYDYARPSYRGVVYPTRCLFPAWVLPEDDPVLRAVVQAHTALYGVPVTGRWTFSTNGVAIMGIYGIPCIGFGPGKESQAHAPDEKTWKKDLVTCAAVYAAIPPAYLDILHL